MRRGVAGALLGLSLTAGAATAQVEVRANGGPIWESYSFDDGLVYEDLLGFSFPRPASPR